MISVIHPSRGRPVQSFERMKEWFYKATLKFELIVSLDNDDETLSHYNSLYQSFPMAHTLNVADNKSSVEAINRAARIAKGDILMVVSDDQEPCPRWAARLLRYVEGKKDWIMKSMDGIQPHIITMPIMDRVYYQRDGYIYYPEYKHLFCDRELTDVAHIRKRVITKNIMFRHKHHSVTHRHYDAIAKRNDETYNEGKKLYLSRKKINFGL